nr:putative nucleolar protein c2c4.08 [Quercus suber]
MLEFIHLIGGEHNLPAQLDTSPAKNELGAEANTVCDPDAVYANLDHVVQYRSGGFANRSTSTPLAISSSVVQQSPSPGVGPHMNLELDPRCGEIAPLGIFFSPWQPVSRFCYRFVERRWQQTLATAFFDANKIWNRKWDLYYIHSDQSPFVKPTVLVPECQFQVVLDEINKQFPEARVAITRQLREEGFVLNFDELRPEHRPRFLGISTSRVQHEHWASIGPVMTQTSENRGEDRSLQAFKKKMALIAELSKNQNKAKKALAHQDRLIQRMGMTKQTLRAQRYLGLLPSKDGSLESSMAGVTLAAVNPEAPSPFPFDKEPIIIAFDVEAWERHPAPITEVGIATLDTRELKGIAPGRVGENWQKVIRARHFRILEYKNVTNHKYVQGCPADFQFGESEFVSQGHIIQNLSRCFKEPFSKSASTISPLPNEPRNIILLGHDISQDINYLAKLGFDVTNRANVLEAMDTSVMFRAYTHDPTARSLGSVLVSFDLTAWHLHNAGNDAVYTLWAMLAIAVESASHRNDASRTQTVADMVKTRTEAAVAEAKDRVIKDAEGWELTGAESDGGPAPPLPSGSVTQELQHGERTRKGKKSLLNK